MGEDTFGFGKMQPLDHLAVDPDRAPAFGLRQAEGGDDGAGAGDFGFGGSEGGVGGGDLGRVDQALAVEAVEAALGAFGGEALGVGEGVIDAVEGEQAVGAGGGYGGGQPRA